MSYRITDYTKKRAKALGVEVKPSRTNGKKIDVFKNGTKVASVGALGYADYPTYMRLEREGKVDRGTAVIRRRFYKARHQKDRMVKGSAGYYADQLLW
jgi:hypothetical protein